MQTDLLASNACIDLIEHFEGLRLTAYRDACGVWTIGYGHTGDGAGFARTITQEEADRLLAQDVSAAENIVRTACAGIHLTQGQFDALVSFVFNVGPGKRGFKSGLVWLAGGGRRAGCGRRISQVGVRGGQSPARFGAAQEGREESLFNGVLDGMKGIKLTRHWQRLHRSYTVIISLLLAVIAAAYEHLPLFSAVLSPKAFAWISMGAGVAIALLRYIDQPCLRGDTQGEPHV